jgi:hypothetical protein
MALRVEFDPSTKTLLLRFEGPLTDDSNRRGLPSDSPVLERSRRHHGYCGLLSSVTEFALSTKLIGRLAKQEPFMPDAATRPRVIVAPKTHRTLEVTRSRSVAEIR